MSDPRPFDDEGTFDRDEPMENTTMPRSVAVLSWIMDDAIPLLGGRRIGVDGFLSFIPVIGDATGFALSTPLIISAVRAGASVPTIIRMLFNAIGETLAGMIPVAGPVVSFIWKANQRNLRIVESELADHEATTRSSVAVLVWTVAMVVLTLGLVIVGAALAAYGLYRWLRS